MLYPGNRGRHLDFGQRCRRDPCPINWYAVPLRASPPTVSGEVIPSLCAGSQPREMEARLKGLELARMNPFRVLGFFWLSSGVKLSFQWRWDRQTLAVESHDWAPTQWLSGYDEPGVQRTRGADFWIAVERNLTPDPDRGSGGCMLP